MAIAASPGVVGFEGLRLCVGSRTGLPGGGGGRPAVAVVDNFPLP